ncbi:glycosyltransferase family 2 protein [Corallibacter sp.]|uniref:glycosyltransferase family 2 protein n=1 Tax=Corallibacter sp. TaxID=2038084 RepID=UPI003A953F5E
MEKENAPLVSICIPTYNGGAFIEETLQSALNQTYKNIEIVITDDKSSDNTLSICNAFAEKDSRIKVYENTANLGLVGNWCESVEKASSKWVKFLFQDDLLEHDCVEKMINAALSSNVNFVICNREYIFEEGFDPKIKKQYAEKLPKTELIFNDPIVYTPKETAKRISPYIFNNCIGEPPTFLFNKDYYSREDYPDTYFQLIDYIFILNKILVHNFTFVNEKLVRFRVHNDSESMRNTSKIENDKKAFHKFIYIQFYEKLQICYEILHNPLFKNVKKHTSENHINSIKNWFVMVSYKRYGFKKVFAFYKASKLNDFIIDSYTSSYSYPKYKLLKVRMKNISKKYNL